MKKIKNLAINKRATIYATTNTITFSLVWLLSFIICFASIASIALLGYLLTGYMDSFTLFWVALIGVVCSGGSTNSFFQDEKDERKSLHTSKLACYKPQFIKMLKYGNIFAWIYLIVFLICSLIKELFCKLLTNMIILKKT